MAQFSGYQGNLSNDVEVAIPISGTTTPAIPLNGFSLVGITTPATFTGTALTFLVSNALAGTYVPLKTTTSGTALSYTVTTSSYYAIDPKDFAGVAFLKIVSGSTEGAARTLICSIKGF